MKIYLLLSVDDVDPDVNFCPGPLFWLCTKAQDKSRKHQPWRQTSFSSPWMQASTKGNPWMQASTKGNPWRHLCRSGIFLDVRLWGLKGLNRQPNHSDDSIHIHTMPNPRSGQAPAEWSSPMSPSSIGKLNLGIRHKRPCFLACAELDSVCILL